MPKTKWDGAEEPTINTFFQHIASIVQDLPIDVDPFFIHFVLYNFVFLIAEKIK